MNREYHKWWSARLGRDMEMLVFGHGGEPILVFPTSQGKYFEYEDRGLISALWGRIESGGAQVYCVDGYDAESWYNRRIHPHDRVARHVQYENYLIHEVLPLIRSKNWAPSLTVTGCSFGGYHAANFAFRHPDIVTRLVSMSGAYDIRSFLGGYYDQDCYFNNPVDFLPNMSDSWYLDRYRRMGIVLATSNWDICKGDNERMSGILRAKGINHWMDVWGDGWVHDWPMWQAMAVKFF